LYFKLIANCYLSANC